MKNVTYKTEWSTPGHAWALYIKCGPAQVGPATQLDLAAEVGTLEWGGGEKYDVIEGASLTVRVVSPDDRSLVHLYTTDPREVEAKLYRDNLLVWIGHLDPEFYSEPYNRRSRYDVELTFGDFGLLSRMDFATTATDFISVDAVVRGALAKAGIPEAYTLKTSLSVSGAPLDLGRLRVPVANFFDEDGEPMTWAEAVECVLKPLGLHLRQDFDRAVVYDLHALATATPAPLSWYPTSDTLSVDKVYKEVTVESSPYGSAKLISPEPDKEGKITATDPKQWTVKNKLTDTATTYPSFSYLLGTDHAEADGIEINTETARFARLTPEWDNVEHECIASRVEPYAAAPAFYTGPFKGTIPDILNNPTASVRLFAVAPRFIGATDRNATAALRVSLDVLIDSRPNPFISAEDDNGKADYTRQEELWQLLSVPVKIWLKGSDGNTYFWDNSRVPDYARSHVDYSRAVGSETNPAGHAPCWVKETSSYKLNWSRCRLTWYDFDRKGGRTPFNGFVTNRQHVGHSCTEPVPQQWKTRGDGEFIPTPPVAGVLHMEVGTGVLVAKYRENSDKLGWVNVHYPQQGGYTPFRWLLFKSPRVEVCNLYGRELDAPDVTATVELDSKAENELTVSLKCGTEAGGHPCARGTYYYGADAAKPTALTSLTRRGQTASVEDHLLSSLAAQYERRHLTLSGSVRSDALGARALFADPAAPGVPLWLQSAALDLSTGCAQCKFIEVTTPKQL